MKVGTFLRLLGSFISSAVEADPWIQCAQIASMRTLASLSTRRWARVAIDEHRNGRVTTLQQPLQPARCVGDPADCRLADDLYLGAVALQHLDHISPSWFETKNKTLQFIISCTHSQGLLSEMRYSNEPARMAAVKIRQ